MVTIGTLALDVISYFMKRCTVRPITHYIIFCTNFWVYRFLLHFSTKVSTKEKPENLKTQKIDVKTQKSVQKHIVCNSLMTYKLVLTLAITKIRNFIVIFFLL